MKCITWNLEWASKASERSRLITEQIRQLDPDVVCYTEIIRSFIPEGYSIEANPDYGYSNTGEKLKVTLWSNSPWTDFDNVGDPNLPSGRFVSGVTRGIRFVGVCIPWKDAHVRTGRKDRAPWQDHLSYCKGLGRVLLRYSNSKEPICVLGDYNQRIPRVAQPENVAKALLNSIPKGYSVVTKSIKDLEGKNLIDHVAVSPTLIATIDKILPRVSSEGIRLSDHVGVVTIIENNKQTPLYGEHA